MHGRNRVRSGLVAVAVGASLSVPGTQAFAAGSSTSSASSASSASSTLSLAAPAKAARGSAVTLTGVFSLGADQQLTVVRQDRAGDHPLGLVTTTADGAFTVGDTVTVAGLNTYTVSSAADGASATAKVTVAGTATQLTVTTDKTAYKYGVKATVTAKLAHFHDGRSICFAAAGTPTRCVTATAAGVATMTYKMTRRTTFTARYAGDQWYAPATATRTVTTAAKVLEVMTGSYQKSGGYYLFHQKKDPNLIAGVQPNRPGACVKFTAQVKYQGKWRTAAVAPCLQLDQDSLAAAVFKGTHPRNVAYRMRASFVTDAVNTASDGAWLKFKFTK